MTRSRLALRLAVGCLISAWALVLSTMTVVLSLEKPLLRRFGENLPAVTQWALDTGHWLRGDLYPDQSLSGFAWLFPLLLAATIKTLRWHRRLTGSLGIVWSCEASFDRPDSPPASERKDSTVIDRRDAVRHRLHPSAQRPSVAGGALTASQGGPVNRLAPALVAGLVAAATAVALGVALVLHGITWPFVQGLI